MIETVDVNDHRREIAPPVSLHGYDARAVSDATGLDTGSDTIVQQHFAEEVDINVIVRRFGVSGQYPLGPSGPAVYGDFSGITDYDSALRTIQRAEESFMALPAEVRARFDNSPAKLIAFAQTVSEDDFVAAFESPPPAPVPPPVPPAPGSSTAEP